MSKTVKYGSKRFLSEEDVYSTGSICVYSCLEEGYEGHIHHDAEIILKDCNKSISLDMRFRNENEFQERVEKIDTLVDELLKFKEVLSEHWKVLQKTKEK